MNLLGKYPQLSGKYARIFRNEVSRIPRLPHPAAISRSSAAQAEGTVVALSLEKRLDSSL